MDGWTIARPLMESEKADINEIFHSQNLSVPVMEKTITKSIDEREKRGNSRSFKSSFFLLLTRESLFRQDEGGTAFTQ